MNTNKHLILRLNMRKEPFELIRSNELTEDYRAIDRYWTSRFYVASGEPRRHTMIEFIHGYGYLNPSFFRKFLGVKKGRGQVDWGAPADKDVYIITFGEKEFFLNFSPAPVRDPRD